MKKTIVFFAFAFLFSQCNLEKIEDDITGGITGNGIKPNFSYTVDGCTPPFTVSFQNLTTGAATYLWNFGTNGTSDAQNPSFVFNTAGVYNITLKGTASNATTVKDTTITVTLNGSTKFEIPSYAPASEVRINTNIVAMADGGYAVAGRRGSDVYLYKCNSTGTKVYDKIVASTTGTLYYPSILRLSTDGDLIIGGTQNKNNAQKFFLLRVSKDGILEKEASLSAPVYFEDESFGFTELTDGTFAVLGRKSNNNATNTEDMVLLHLDAVFNIKTERTFDLGFKEKVIDVVAEGDKNITVFVDVPNGSTDNMHLVKIELTNYSITDDRNISTNDPDLDFTYSAAKSQDGNSYILSGSAKSGAAYVLSISKTGTKLNALQSENGAFLWVSATPDNGFVAGGYSFSSGYFIVKADKNLNQEHAYMYSSFSLAPECDGVMPTSDGGYISTGRLNSGSTTTPLIFKHDCTLRTN